MTLDRENIRDYIDELDVINLWTWHANDIVDIEANVARCETLFPGKPIVAGLYLYDYGDGRRIPLDLLEMQCETALRLVHAGRIEGIEFTTINNDDAAVAWTANWLRRVGDQVIGSDAGERWLKIDKFYFMFHPVCWGMGMHGDQPPPVPAGASKEDYLACYEWELERHTTGDSPGAGGRDPRGLSGAGVRLGHRRSRSALHQPDVRARYPEPAESAEAAL